MRIFLYGLPGSGKTTIGRRLAQQLGLPFYDLDQEIELRASRSVSEIFSQLGEPGFRRMETTELQRFLAKDEFVLALGGGALLSDVNREAALRAGQVVCLSAGLDTLIQRTSMEAGSRPLLKDDLREQLGGLLLARSDHYAAFPLQVETDHLSPADAAWEIMRKTGRFRLNAMGASTDIFAESGILSRCGDLLSQAGLRGPVLVVSDDHVTPLYAGHVVRSLQNAGLAASSYTIPSGESSKNLSVLTQLWEAMLSARLDRKSALLALGGGVVTDLAGFAAATFLRGIQWVAAPTSLLGMVDAGLGGKTGIDLPQGKNLVGAFYPPRLALVDPDVLQTLPEAEWRNGLAEVVKAAVIASPGLFERLCATPFSSIDWEPEIRAAMAIKLRVVEEDPLESDKRVILNLGHTIGHAVERASQYRIRHGEAVAIGLTLEASIGEALGVTQSGTAGKIASALSNLGLPVEVPQELKQSELRQAFAVDKKRRSGNILLPLPVAIGAVRYDIEIEEEQLWSLFLSCMART